eukprot:Selendium_serpulae@DN4233_c0_g1_i1.p2
MTSALTRRVVVTGYSRTPIGAFLGGLSGLTAPELGGIAIKNAVAASQIDPADVQEVIMGHVLQAGCGQAPARQASINAGVPVHVDAWSVNKVCSSGLKAITLGAAAIAAGDCEIVVGGGMESMSNAPHLLGEARRGYRYGHGELSDSLLLDGLTDPYNKIHMGACCERTMQQMGLTRDAADRYAAESYRRAAEAWRSGAMAGEVAPVQVATGRGKNVKAVLEDEDFRNFDVDKASKLKTVFAKDGTITAANASSLSDGAAAVVLMAEETARRRGIRPLGEILSAADAAVLPIDFAIAPATAAAKALAKAKMAEADVYEFNEAFSGVVLANMQLSGAPL